MRWSDGGGVREETQNDAICGCVSVAVGNVWRSTAVNRIIASILKA